MNGKKYISAVLALFCLVFAGCAEKGTDTDSPSTTDGVRECEHSFVETGYADIRFCRNCNEIDGGELPDGVRFVEYTLEGDESISVKFVGKLDETDRVIEGVAVYDDKVGRIETSEEGFGTYEITYDNGNVYCGHLNRIFRHGIGSMDFANGDRYEGTFENDFMSGDGSGGVECVYTYKNGDVYKGDFAGGNPNGDGVVTYADGSVYEGSFVDGHREGRGSYTFANGDMYTGEYIADMMEGNGVYVFANGDMYTGEYKANLREGNGTYVFANGDKYEGEFVAGDMHGKGTYTLADGRSYSGLFENGQIVVGSGEVIEIPAI